MKPRDASILNLVWENKELDTSKYDGAQSGKRRAA